MAVFIPKTYKKGPATIYIEFQLLETVDKLAAKYNMSRSEFINQSIKYAIEHLPDLKKAIDEK